MTTKDGRKINIQPSFFFYIERLVLMIPDKKRAFTLVELMIVVLVLGVLTAIAIPRITQGTFQAGVNACRNNVDTINKQIELYHAQKGTWPAALKDVINDPNFFPDGPPECPFNKPYIMITANGKYRVAEHIHLDSKEIKAISDKVFNKN